ncbi:Putative fluoride ion transporter CrcB [Arthrobacter saudimassiliensis]|uniref:Fluoride-specific ion channel FluC n=1 Tax=Arthrobacter saudimassiliensis TaxID=1461584 RepID=A0A078MQP4_9MICC|nr:Putative fluoride ion transporter CrcB [Arthrobacter saudimassiliensis]
MSVLAAVAVAAGGMLGALARFGLDTLLLRRAGTRPWAALPVGTLLVNVAGSALIGAALQQGIGGADQGAAYALLQGGGLSAPAYAAVTAGLAGGLTTFSSWAVASVLLWNGDRRLAAVLNLALNVVLGAAACAGGWLVGDWLSTAR